MKAGTRRGILIAGLVLLIAGGTTCLVIPSGTREPVYQGKKLSQWLNEGLNSQRDRPNEDYDKRPDVVAIRQIGTNGLPTLLELLSARDGKVKQVLIDWTKRLPAGSLRPVSEDEKHWMALYGFRVLGPIAKPATPSLLAMVKEKGATHFIAAEVLWETDRQAAVNAGLRRIYE